MPSLTKKVINQNLHPFWLPECKTLHYWILSRSVFHIMLNKIIPTSVFILIGSILCKRTECVSEIPTEQLSRCIFNHGKKKCNFFEMVLLNANRSESSRLLSQCRPCLVHPSGSGLGLMRYKTHGNHQDVI